MASAFDVLDLLLEPAFVAVAVVGRAALVGASLTVGLGASEGTPQIAAPRIARVAQKEDPTVPTSSQAPAPRWAGLQNRSQQRVILEDQLRDDAGPIPIRFEPKMLLDPDCKKPKPSLRMLTLD